MSTKKPKYHNTKISAKPVSHSADAINNLSADSSQDVAQTSVYQSAGITDGMHLTPPRTLPPPSSPAALAYTYPHGCTHDASEPMRTHASEGATPDGMPAGVGGNDYQPGNAESGCSNSQVNAPLNKDGSADKRMTGTGGEVIVKGVVRDAIMQALKNGIHPNVVAKDFHLTDRQLKRILQAYRDEQRVLMTANADRTGTYDVSSRPNEIASDAGKISVDIVARIRGLVSVETDISKLASALKVLQSIAGDGEQADGVAEVAALLRR